MGSKYVDPSYPNMLAYNAATFNIKNDQVFNVSVQTWNGDWDGTYVKLNPAGSGFVRNGLEKSGVSIWRKHKEFEWNGQITEDGNYGSAFSAFDTPSELLLEWDTRFHDEVEHVSEGPQNKWVKTLEILRYNHYSYPIEQMDINEDRVSTLLDIQENYVVASGMNASIGSFSATSFEEEELLPNGISVHFGGEVIGSGSNTSRRLSINALDDGVTPKINKISAHTGEYYIKIEPYQKGPSYISSPTLGLQTYQDYRASVWMHKSNFLGSLCVEINGGSPIEALKSSGTQYGDWIQVILDFNVPLGASIEVYPKAGGSDVSYFDDFRVGPVNAAVTSYTYDRAGNITSILNPDNFGTRYYYDPEGRLIKTETETEKGFEKVSAHQYNFAGSFSVNPTTLHEVSYEGIDKLEFGYTKSSGLVLDFSETSPWIEILTPIGADHFSVRVDPNVTCGMEYEGELVVKTNEPTAGEVRIPFIQHAPPVYSHFHFQDASQEELTSNSFQIDETYWIEFDHCERLDTRTLDLVACELDNNGDIWRRVEFIRSQINEYSSETGTYNAGWHVSADPATGVDWRIGGEYYVVLEDHYSNEMLMVSDMITIAKEETSPEDNAQMLMFIEPVPGSTFTLSPTLVDGDQRYALPLEWYTNYGEYEYLTFTLEIHSTYFESPIGEIGLASDYLDWLHVPVFYGRQTWILFDYQIEEDIRALFNSEPENQLPSYYYKIWAKEDQGGSSPCPTGDCTSASTQLFQIDGLDFDW